MKSFTESGLDFRFNDDWVVKKYDSHRYYKGLSGVGLKGIDFIALNIKENLAVFFEVKNYRTRYRVENGEPIYPTLKAPDILGQALSEKIKDTLLAINAITTYFRKSFLYRLFLPLIIRLPLYRNDRFFWTKVAHCIYEHHNLQVVFWVELEEVDTPYIDELNTIVDRLLKEETIQVFLADTRQHPFSSSLKVEVGMKPAN